MTHSAIALNILESLNVARNFPFQITLNLDCFYNLANAGLHVSCKLLTFYPESHLCFCQNLVRSRSTDAIDGRQAHLYALILGYIYACDSHPCFCLCLPLIQIIYKRPRLRTSLHLGHRFFTDALTLMSVATLRFVSSLLV